MSDAEPRHQPVATDPRDVSPTLVGVLALGLAVFLALSFWLIAVIYPQSWHGPSDAPRLATSAPSLQSYPARDLADYLAAQNRALDTYAWIDRGRGIVRIPIAQAMKDVAAAGIKDWPGGGR